MDHGAGDDTGNDADIQHSIYDTPLGEMLLVAQPEGLKGAYFLGDGVKHVPDLSECGRNDADVKDPTAASEILSMTKKQLEQYFAGPEESGETPAFSVPLAWEASEASEFSRTIWSLLCEIPYGKTTTYGQLAQRLGTIVLSQRVGQVVGRNPWSIIVPCHRVIGADGSLTGYAGGLERKRWLLRHEEPDAEQAQRLF